jgi:hypothetical protein
MAFPTSGKCTSLKLGIVHDQDAHRAGHWRSMADYLAVSIEAVLL